MTNDITDKINSILENNFQNESFGVSELAREMGMSRSNLHRKMGDAVKVPANQYIRRFRLQKGMDLLKQSSLTVSEVAYRTGFNSPAYFIKCFGDYYGYAPGKVESSGELKENISDEKSILVLPFKNISSDLEQDYFCDGLTEEIIIDLSHINELRVISRSSAMSFKESNKKINEIVDEVNVEYVLEGSVRKSDKSVKITAQLIDAKKDAHIWAEKYGGKLDDLFDIQENVSRSIADALKIKLNSNANKQLADTAIENIHAFEWYLKAKKEMQFPKGENFNHALTYLHKAIDLVGENAAIYAAIGTVYCNYLEFGINHNQEILKKANEYAFKALKLSPNSAGIYCLLGRIERFSGSAVKAINYFTQALDINPNDVDALGWASLIYSADLGKGELAAPLLKKLMIQDPLSPFNHLVIGIHNWTSLEFDKAIDSFNKMLILDPGNIMALFCSSYVYFWKNEMEKAFTLIKQINELEVDTPMKDVFGAWLSFLKYAIQGEKNKAMKMLSPEIKEYFWNDPDLILFGAGAFAILDKKEEALQWVEHSVNKGIINYPLYVEKDPFLKNIRSEPQFLTLMEKVKHEWETFEN